MDTEGFVGLASLIQAHACAGASVADVGRYIDNIHRREGFRIKGPIWDRGQLVPSPEDDKKTRDDRRVELSPIATCETRTPERRGAADLLRFQGAPGLASISAVPNQAIIPL